ncbi:hypothetical protein LWI29_036871 [Acer saccharum]|uniref:Uncharacterized protein n=1 Tax=Acer saccharum TaxID=4024 RepID=A0AA39VPM2_ACESA|nr:hypothetical protein LWI29_036871 [Acer saccharum]
MVIWASGYKDFKKDLDSGEKRSTTTTTTTKSTPPPPNPNRNRLETPKNPTKNCRCKSVSQTVDRRPGRRPIVKPNRPARRFWAAIDRDSPRSRSGSDPPIGVVWLHRCRALPSGDDMVAKPAANVWD